MIRRIRSRGLRALYVNSDASRVDPRHLTRLRLILDALDGAQRPSDMNIAGLGFHALSGNWRVTFRFETNEATDVDYVDYH